LSRAAAVEKAESSYDEEEIAGRPATEAVTTGTPTTTSPEALGMAISALRVLVCFTDVN